jgi:predicted RNase H-like nuclease (RuvC/YqgF family)
VKPTTDRGAVIAKKIHRLLEKQTMSKEIARRILEIEDKLAKGKSNRSELKGQLKSALEQWKEFKIDNPDHVPIKIEELDTEIEKIDRLLGEKTEEVEILFEPE